MAKLSLDPAPTFTAPVPIPVAGSASVPVQFTFKHRDREALDTYMDELKALDAAGSSLDNDVSIVFKVATAWELDDPFDEPSVRRLLKNYHGSAWAIARTYIRELVQAREGN